MSSTLAEMQETPMEMPIDIVGEKVKSGQKVLADIDSATGAVTVREKYRDYTEIILQKVEEQRNWEQSQGEHPTGESDDTEVEALARAEEVAAQEEAKAAEGSGKASVPEADLAGVSPAILALLERQQALLEKMAGQNPTQAAAELSRQHGVIAEGRREIAKHRARLEDDIAHAERTGCPRPPKKNPRFGDKTPAYVEWLKAYRPDAYEARYGVVQRDKSFRKTTRDGQVVSVTADIARRKVHTTEKPEQDPTLAADMDWNA